MTKRTNATFRLLRRSRFGAPRLRPGQEVRGLHFESLEARRLLAVLSPDSSSPDALEALGTAYPHIDPNLLALFPSAASLGTAATTGAALQAGLSTSSLMFDSAGRVGVKITAESVDQLLPSLVNLGFQTVAALPAQHLVEGYLPGSALVAANNLSSVGLMGVLPMYRPMTASVGSFTDEADNVMQSDRVRAAASGANGAGVKVGVLSDSYNNLGGASTDVANGDLPAGVTVVQDFSSGGSDEGRAMSQLVHHVAPGASIAFATAFNSETSFAQNIRTLAAAPYNCQVIVDDVTYYDEPFFQDGTVAQAINDVVTNNHVAYFSAAGNNSDQAYESTNVSFQSATISAISKSQYNYYQFAPGAYEQSITIPAGVTVNLVLQWDQPFYTTSGVKTSLYLYLLDSSGSKVVKSAMTNNITTRTPYQYLQYTNTSSTAQFNIVIRKPSASTPTVGRIKYVDYGDGADITFNNYATNSPTISPHAGSANAMAVAAVPYFNQLTPESYSSTGPVTILFDASGNRLSSAEVRAKPDITSVDGTTTSFFAQNNLGDGRWHFFGTSAAAPHAAAEAVLLKSANPALTPAQIYAQLESTADPNVGGTPGNTNQAGAGLIDAYAAVIGQPVPASVNTFDGFESGTLGQSWEIYNSGAGRTQVISTNNPATGTYQLALDGSSDSISGHFGATPVLSEAILHVNALGALNVSLAFDEKDFGNDPDSYTMPVAFSGHGNYDGVALSVDGTNWYLVEGLTGSASTNSYQHYNLDLSAIAAANGLILGADTRIKFQHYVGTYATSYTVPNQGFAFDNIQVSSALPDLTVGKTHTGTFRQGDVGDTYTITVTNAGSGATSGSVSLVDTLPAGLTATAMNGTGWTIDLATLTATRSDSLSAGASYPALTLTVNVAANAPTSLTNMATVSGGGEQNTSNDTAIDATTIIPIPSPPTVTAVSTTAAANSHYTLGGTIPITVAFSQVVVVGGTPQLALNDGAQAVYTGGSETATLIFTYTVAAGQNTTDLDYTSTAALSLNGGSIQDVAGNPAELTLPATGTNGLATANIVIETAPPSVTSNPSDQTILTGGTASFTAAASGNPPPTVQWEVNTGNGFTGLTDGGVYSGSSTDTLTITGAGAAMSGFQYAAVFSNGVGSPATTLAATLTVQAAPFVITNPTNQTVVAGGTASFTAAAGGNPSPTVQWEVNTGDGFTGLTDGGVYSGSSTDTLAITGAAAAMSGYQYEAVFSNGVGSPATTLAGTLTVQAAPFVITNPSNQTIQAGGTASFTAAASGNPSPTVQWEVNTGGGFTGLTDGGVYSGSSTDTLTITGAAAAMSGFQYVAVFSNGVGSPATTLAAMLIVQVVPSVTTNPSNQTILVGSTASFTAAAGGNPPPTVQWEVNTGSGFSGLTDGGVYSGSSTDTLTITGAAVGMSGYQYAAVFSNGVGSPATTTAAALTVVPASTIGTWISTVDGPWNAPSNWSDTQGIGAPGFSSLTGDQATFNGVAGLNVDLGNSSPIITGLTFGPSALNYDIKSTGSGLLQLNNGNSNATITVSAGSQTIAAPIQLASNTAIYPAASATLNISSSIISNTGTSLAIGDATNTGKLVEASSGSVSIAGSTNVAAGTLQVDGTWTTAALNFTAFGGGQGSGHLAGSGTINLISADGFDYNSTADSVFTGQIMGSASKARLTVTEGRLTLSGSNTSTGGTTVTGGKLILTSPSAIADGTSLTVGADAALIFGSAAAAAPSATAAATPANVVVAGSKVLSGVTIGQTVVAASLALPAIATAASNKVVAIPTLSAAVVPAVQSPSVMQTAIPTDNRDSGRVQLSVVPQGASAIHDLVHQTAAPARLPSLQSASIRSLPVSATARFDWSVMKPTTGGVAWLGPAFHSTDASDQHDKKDVAIRVLETVFAQYGR